MSRLMLHIGHTKTGSSYIQSTLAMSVSVLASHGINYPEPNATGPASEGKISSGNGTLFRSSVIDCKSSKPHDPIGLYSSEDIFILLGQRDFQQDFRRYAQSYEKIDVLMFTRDPVSHACSRFQQAVKRDGYTGDVRMYFESVTTPSEVREVMSFLEAVDNVRLTVSNYSVAPKRAIDKVEAWLGVAPGTLIRPAVKIVNRSMTFPELEAQRILNVALGPSGHLLSDYLCNELPDVKPDDVRPDIALQAALWERFAEPIAWINERVAPSERYDFDRDVRPPTLVHPGYFAFSEQQLRLIMREFARPHVLARGSDEGLRRIAL